MLNTHAEATFQIPDVTKVLAVPDLLKIYMQPAVVAIAQKIESDLLRLYAGFTANAPVGTAGTHDHGSDDRRGGDGPVPGQGSAHRAEVPGGGCQHLFGTGGRFRGSANSRPRATPGLRALVDGTVGKIKDFFVFRSQFVEKTGSSPVTTHNLAFTKNAMGLVMRRLPQPLPGTGAIAEYAELGNFGMRVVMSYQPNTLAQQFTVDVLYGCGVSAECGGRAGEHLDQPVSEDWPSSKEKPGAG